MKEGKKRKADYGSRWVGKHVGGESVHLSGHYKNKEDLISSVFKNELENAKNWEYHQLAVLDEHNNDKPFSQRMAGVPT